MSLTVERHQDGALTVRDPTVPPDPSGRPAVVITLTFRDCEALSATARGYARQRWGYRMSTHWCDSRLVLECDAYGVGAGTLDRLQYRGLITKPDDEGPIALTDLGGDVLTAIRNHQQETA